MDAVKNNKPVSQKDVEVGGKEIVDTSPLPGEILKKIMSQLCISDRANLGKTDYYHLFFFYASVLKGNNDVADLCKQGMSAVIRTIFNHYPLKINDDCVPYTDSGRSYLKERIRVCEPGIIQRIKEGLTLDEANGISGPKMVQRIKEGLPIDEALRIRAGKLAEINHKLNDPDTTERQKSNLQQPLIQKYIIDESMTIDEGANLTDNGQYVFFNRESPAAKYIDNNSLSIKWILKFIADSDKSLVNRSRLGQFLRELEKIKSSSYLYKPPFTDEERADLLQRLNNDSLTLQRATDIIDDRCPETQRMKELFWDEREEW